MHSRFVRAAEHIRAAYQLVFSEAVEQARRASVCAAAAHTAPLLRDEPQHALERRRISRHHARAGGEALELDLGVGACLCIYIMSIWMIR